MKKIKLKERHRNCEVCGIDIIVTNNRMKSCKEYSKKKKYKRISIEYRRDYYKKNYKSYRKELKNKGEEVTNDENDV